MKSFCTISISYGRESRGFNHFLTLFYRLVVGDSAGSPYRGKITIYIRVLQSGSPYGAGECPEPALRNDAKAKPIYHYCHQVNAREISIIAIWCIAIVC